MSQIDFETDLLKHYVRKFGWLKASKQQKQQIGARLKEIPLRYFTFCAADAIDVFMLLREGILTKSDETGRLEGVYFCEKDLGSFGEIASLIRTPEQGFQGDFHKIVLFKDDEETRDKRFEDDEPYTPELRKKLHYKDANHRLREAFPFDVINLDVCGVMFPSKTEPRQVITPLLRSINQILKWQMESSFSSSNGECSQFTLFLTSHVDPALTDENAVQQLKNRVIDNISESERFQSAFLKRYGHNQVKKLIDENFAEFFCIALPKYMIHMALHDYGWQVTCRPAYLYNRDDKWKKNKQYQIMHTVSVCERIPGFQQSLDAPSIGQYFRSVTQLINDGVQWVDDAIENPDVSLDLEEDLRQIVRLRDEFRNS